MKIYSFTSYLFNQHSVPVTVAGASGLPVAEMDLGLWSCRAYGGAGRAEHKYHDRVRGRVTPEKMVTVTVQQGLGSTLGKQAREGGGGHSGKVAGEALTEEAAFG